MNAEIKTHFEAYINDVDFDVEAEYLPISSRKPLPLGMRMNRRVRHNGL